MRGEWVNSAVQPGLTHPGLAHQGHELPVTGGGSLERLAKLLELGLAADEARRDRGGGACRRDAPDRRPAPRTPRAASASPFTGTGPSDLTRRSLRPGATVSA